MFITQSSHPFETTTQHPHSSQSSQLTTLKPNKSSQHSQLIKKLKPHPTIRYKPINDGNWIDAEIINRAGKATRKYSNCWNISKMMDNNYQSIFQKWSTGKLQKSLKQNQKI